MKTEKTLAKISANTIKKVAEESVSRFSFWGFYQAKVPAQLKKR